MLTPIAAAQVAPAAIRTHGSETRTAGGHPAGEGHVETREQHASMPSPTIGMSVDTVLSNVNAVTATAASRTVLQLLAFAIAAQLGVNRQPNETLDAFFLRIAATIMEMKEPDRAALEVRSGLKVLNIRLTDLATALKAPEGNMAARIAAMAEAPRTPFARAAAALATNSYLQEGMGAPRSSETFSIEAAVRSNDNRASQAAEGQATGAARSADGDARGLQSQLKVMFEAGAAVPPDRGATGQLKETVLLKQADLAEQAVPAEWAGPAAELVTAGEQAAFDALPPADAAVDPGFEAGISTSEPVAQSTQSALSTPVLDNEEPSEVGAGSLAPDAAPGATLEAAEAGPSQLDADATPQAMPYTDEPVSPREAGRLAIDEKVHVARGAEKAEIADRRLETLLTLKGFSEALVTKPALPDHIVSQPDPADPWRRHAMAGEPASAVASEALGRIEKAVASATSAIHRHQASLAAVVAEQEGAAERHQTVGIDQTATATRTATDADEMRTLKSAFTPDLVPFAYAPLQPAKEEFQAEAVDEERDRDEDADEEQGDEKQAETGDERRARLAKQAQDELLDTPPEDTPTIAVNRDSSDADRAYAQYQRMAGF